jgi:hypothetical protein
MQVINLSRERNVNPTPIACAHVYGIPKNLAFSVDYGSRRPGSRGGTAMSPDFQVTISESVDSSKWGVKLEHMRKLKAGWNGYSAQPPSHSAIVTAKSFLYALLDERSEPSRVAPSAEGGVGVTHKGKRRRVYVEFFNDGQVLALFSDGKSHPKSERINPGTDQFRALTKKIREYLDA